MLKLGSIEVKYILIFPTYYSFSYPYQEFADVTCNKLQKYKINENLILSMKVSKVDYLDGYQGLTSNNDNNDRDANSFFKATFLNPYLKNWIYSETIALDMGNSFFYRETYPSSLKFYDENGLDLSLNFKKGKICAGDRCLSTEFKGYRAFNIKVIYVNGTVTFTINDEKIYSSKKRFSKLKYIQHTFYAHTFDDTSDTLVNFTLSEIK